MAEVVARIGGNQPGRELHALAPVPVPEVREDKAAASPEKPEPAADNRRALRLTLEEVPHPAYMVNYNFELTWYNDAARENILSDLAALPAHSEARNLFLLLFPPGSETASGFRSELLRVHLALAKNRLSKGSVLGLLYGLDRAALALADRLYDESVVTSEKKPILDFSVELDELGGVSKNWRVFAQFFREGIFIVYIPTQQYNATLLEFLSQRDVVIRDLMRKRLPVLTPLAVLVADLQNSVKICSELPPEEYFDLINEIWTSMGPIFRKYYGTYGKHVGDGMVYYFFPQPDSDYIFNALACAQELKSEIRKISKKWQLRKNWLNELYLNTGLHEGQEWLGTFQTATSVEFAVLGDTINHASRLSEFARFGTIWATKNLLSKLEHEKRATVDFGITRKGGDGQEHFVASSYSQLGSMVDLSAERHEKLRDIAMLPITEIRSVKLGT
ncbi:MAG: adenylate/guanylate cyclase domain-containing protein [Proteobacteria bacterium]|nr:adenylate/guanylate cyclase domain-containing protein [Pseudomonadota bacterium]